METTTTLLIDIILIIVCVIVGYIVGWKAGKKQTIDDLFEKNIISESQYKTLKGWQKK